MNEIDVWDSFSITKTITYIALQSSCTKKCKIKPKGYEALQNNVIIQIANSQIFVLDGHLIQNRVPVQLNDQCNCNTRPCCRPTSRTFSFFVLVLFSLIFLMVNIFYHLQNHSLSFEQYSNKNRILQIWLRYRSSDLRFFSRF